MNDHYDPRNRRVRLEETFAQFRQARLWRTTMRLLWVITALAILLTLVVMQRYGVF